MTDGSEWNMEIWRPEVVRHTRAQPECDMFNRGSSYFHVPRTTVCHVFCRMTNKICLQDGGNAAFLRVYPQDGGNKQNVNKNNVKYILRLHLVNVTYVTRVDIMMSTRVTVKQWTYDNAQSHVTAFRPISEAAHSWSYNNKHWQPARSANIHDSFCATLDMCWAFEQCDSENL